MKTQSEGGKLNCVGFAFGLFLLTGPLVLAIACIVEIASTDGVIPEARFGSLLLMGVAAFGGSFVGYFGYVIVGFNFDSLPSRPRWLFGVMLLVGILWLPHLGVGTIVGLGLLVFTIRQRDKFDFGKPNVVQASMSGVPSGNDCPP